MNEQYIFIPTDCINFNVSNEDIKIVIRSKLFYYKKKCHVKSMEQKQKDEIFAALKLIECLYLQGMIPKHIYNNIYKEYSA